MATAQEYYSNQARISFKTAHEVKALFSALEKMRAEVTFVLDNEGLRARFMDLSHIALVDLSFPGWSLASYDFTGSKHLQITINMKEATKALSSLNPKHKESVILTFTDKTLEIKGENGSKTINAQEPETLAGTTPLNTPLPKLNYYAKIALTSQLFDDLLTDIQAIEVQRVKIESTQKTVKFSGKSDIGEGCATIERDTDGLIDLKVMEDSASIYDLNYLLRFNRAMKTGFNAVTVEYSRKMPLKLEYLISGAGGKITYWIAPIVQDPTDINEIRRENAKEPAPVQEPPKSTETTNEPAEITPAEINEHVSDERINDAENEVLLEARQEDMMNGKEPIEPEPVKPVKRQARKPKKAPIEPPKGEKWYFTVDGSIKAKNEDIALAFLQELFDPLQEKLIVGLACPAVKDDRFTVTGTLIAENEASALEIVQKAFTGLVEQKIIRLKSPSVTSERELAELEQKEAATKCTQ